MTDRKVLVHVTDDLQPEVEIQQIAEDEGFDYLAFSSIPQAAKSIAGSYREGRLAAIVTDLELRRRGVHPGRDKTVGMAFINRIRRSDTVPAELFDNVVCALVEALSADREDREEAREHWQDISELLLVRPEVDETEPLRYDVPIIVYSGHADDPDVREYLEPLERVALIKKGRNGAREVRRALREL